MNTHFANLIPTQNQSTSQSRAIITRLDQLLQVVQLDLADLMQIDTDNNPTTHNPNATANAPSPFTPNLSPSFPLRVPLAFAQKIKKGDKNDPLLRQILPLSIENQAVAGFGFDPLQEQQFNHSKGLLHKYRSRVLLTITGACLINCRYCFRQHFDYQSNLPDESSKAALLQYIAQDCQINEVILSGGDPLSLSQRRLFEWLDMLADTHIDTIRLHTRLPVAMPDIIDDALLVKLQQLTCQKNIVIVIHTNHPNEIDTFTKQQLTKLKRTGVTLLNQSVLLKGVNDDVDVLVQLSQRLFDAGVLPYYLHILDKVHGAAHFAVPKQHAISLYWQMLEQLAGYLVPKLVEELANYPYKVPVDVYKRLHIG